MPDCIEVVQRIGAPPERLWAGLTEPQHLANWQADRASGRIDDRKLRLAWPVLGVETELSVLEASRERLLVLSSGRSKVSFELEPGVLRLVHDGLHDQDERDGVHASWQVALKVLDHYLCQHYDEPRQVHWAVAPAPATPEAVHVFYTDRVGLDAWLTRKATTIGEAGSSCELLLRWGERLKGVVLTNALERDVAITWQERDNSVLVFRTLPSPFVRGERILAISWSHWNCNGDDQATCDQLTSALKGLRQVLVGTGIA